MRIITRLEWGGTPAVIGGILSGPVSEIVAHHTVGGLPATASIAQEAAQMRAWEEQHRRPTSQGGLGAVGIGYAHVFFQSGRVYEGRGFGRRGAHAGAKANPRTLGWAFAIDSRRVAPSDDALAAWADMRRLAVRDGHLTQAHDVKPHNFYAKTTACPGPKILTLLPTLRAPLQTNPGPGPAPHPSLSAPVPGSRVWSEYFREYLIVTHYVSDDEWYFVRESQVRTLPDAVRASTRFSQMPQRPA